MSLVGSLVQTVNNRRRVVISYDDWLAEGEVITAVSCTVDQGTATVDTAKVLSSDGRSVQFFVNNGTLGDLFNVIVQVTTSFSQVRSDTVAFSVATNGGSTALAASPQSLLSILGALAPVTFASLPATPTEGMVAAVKDSPVTGNGTALVTGGGTNHVLAYYNGAGWKVIV